MKACSEGSTIGPATVAIVNAKGGVGKTSLVANLASWMASAGHRVLAVDLDPQGNLAHDLGYLEQTDNGRHLLDALRGTGPPLTLREVRPGLDVWCGGPQLARSVGALTTRTGAAHRRGASRGEPSDRSGQGGPRLAARSRDDR
jgi:chromosome partitioning protein